MIQKCHVDTSGKHLGQDKTEHNQAMLLLERDCVAPDLCQNQVAGAQDSSALQRTEL